MKRRSFISLLGAVPLMRMQLWGEEAGGAPAREWGPPVLKAARAEHLRVILSFTPVDGATSYQVRYGSAGGATATLEGVLVTDYAVLGLKNGTEYQFSVAATGPQGTTGFSNELKATPTSEMDWKSLAEGFAGLNPTRSTCPFWMVHGDESDEELRQFMEVAYRFGFEGVTLHPYNFQGFLEDGMWKRWRVILEQARKLGLVVWQQDDKNYASGYAAGKVVAKDRRLARWEVALPHREHHRGPKPLTLDVNAVLPAKHHLVGVSAFGPGHRIEDLSELVSNGQLHWEVPAGDWGIFVTAAWQPGMDNPRGYPDLAYGEVRGYIDPLSPEATDRYVETIYGATLKELGADLNGVWKGWFIDEPSVYSSAHNFGELGNSYPYTPDLVARCRERYGYSMRPLLPLLWVEYGPSTVRLRRDYLDFVSGEFARLFIGKITQFCEAHGLQLTGHALEYPSPPLAGSGGNAVRTVEALSMGGFDSILDQWYLPEEDVYWRQTKMASSISHYKQTPQDEAMVEHFAGTGWRTGLTEMKAMMDWTTTRGLNHIVSCGLDTADPPVWEDAPEFWLHGKSPLAPYFRAFQVMANRETMMIRGGRHVAKAIILDNAESRWVGPAEEPERPSKALSQAHFDYDIVSYDYFVDPARCRFEDKRVHLGREDYEVVVLPGADAVPEGVMRRLLEFYEGGGTVISVGPGQTFGFTPTLEGVQLIWPRVPVRSTDGQHDAEVKELVDRLWGSRASGRGRAYLTTYKDIKNLLYSLDAHDVWIDPNLEMLQYYHRRLSGRDLYFFNNEGEAVHTTVSLRGAKGVPEFWDPVTASISQAPCYATDTEGLHLRLDLERYESVFVVINPDVQPAPHLTSTDADEVRRGERGQMVLKKYSPGTVQYSLARPGGTSEEKRRAVPGKEFASLTLREGWSRTPTGINGAVYKTRFDWPTDAPLTAMLVIDGMTQAIRAKLNGKDLGLCFTYPFRFDLGEALQRGSNELELEHTERHTFTSKLGTICVVPYYAVQV